MLRASRVFVVATIAALVFGCSASTPSATPVVTTPPPTIVPSIAPSPTPTPTPSPTPKPAPLDVVWSVSKDPATPKAADWETMHHPTWTKLGNTFVLAAGEQGDESGPRVWLSDDAIHWHAVIIDKTPDVIVSVQAVTTGGPGLVALGEVSSSVDDTTVEQFWTSTDGLSWTRATTTGLSGGQLWLMHATVRGSVWYDQSGAQVTAYAGPAWTGADPFTIVDTAGTLTAFVGENPGKPIEVWQSAGGAAWAKLATMPGADGGIVQRAAQGPAGWVAFGCDTECGRPVAWTSADGLAWTVVPYPPIDEINAIVADQAGFVAVGQRVTGLGCVVGEGDVFGETWTSSTGRTWRQMPDQPSFNRASIHGLLVTGRTLVGLGTTWPQEGGPASTSWTFALPDASSDEGVSPTPAPSTPAGPSPSGEGCGG